jgi:DNA end-binding protein Ku
MKTPAEFVDEIAETKVTAEERKLTDTLIDASTISDFDLAAYEDEYTVTLRELIEAKVEGKEIVAAPEPEEPKVINLMEALKASVESAQAAGAGKKAAKLAEEARESGARKRAKTGTG